jgi:hypothetical protein
MSLEYIIMLLTLASLLAPPFIYQWKELMQRIKSLEEAVKTRTTEEEVRQLIDDKMESSKEDLHEIKARLDKIIDNLITKK